MTTIRDQITTLKAEIAQLICLSKYDGVTLDTEIVDKVDHSNLIFKGPVYTVVTEEDGTRVITV